METLANFFIYSFAVYISASILPGVSVSNFLTAMTVTVILGLVNTFIKPLFILFTLPISILTLGLFTFLINAFMIIIVDMIVSGFEVRSFGWALAFSLLLSILNSIMFSLTKP